MALILKELTRNTYNKIREDHGRSAGFNYLTGLDTRRWFGSGFFSTSLLTASGFTRDNALVSPILQLAAAGLGLVALVSGTMATIRAGESYFTEIIDSKAFKEIVDPEK